MMAMILLAGCSSVSQQDVTDTLEVSQARAQEFIGLASAFDAIASTVPDAEKRGILKSRIGSAVSNYRRLSEAQDMAIRKLGEVDYEALYQRLETVGGQVWDRLSSRGDE